MNQTMFAPRGACGAFVTASSGRFATNSYAGVVPALTSHAMERLGALLMPMGLDGLGATREHPNPLLRTAVGEIH
jgi:hypothetical protein